MEKFEFPYFLERKILEIFGWDIGKIRKLAKKSFELAEEIHIKRKSFEITEGTLEPHVFYFFPRTLAINYKVSKILEKFIEEKEIEIQDIGAGIGSASIAFMLAMGEKLKLLAMGGKLKLKIRLQDISEIAIKFGEKMIKFLAEYFDIPCEVFLDRSSAEEIKSADISFISFALSDIFDTYEEKRIFVERVLKKSRIVAITEPAYINSSQDIQRISDDFRKFVVAPCTHKEPCPLLKVNDWCHFHIRWNPPEFLKRGMNMIKKDPPKVKFSFLILKRKKVEIEEGENVGRVISPKFDEKGKITFFLCSPRGKIKVSVLKRDMDLDLYSGDKIMFEDWEEKGGEIRAKRIKILDQISYF